MHWYRMGMDLLSASHRGGACLVRDGGSEEKYQLILVLKDFMIEPKLHYANVTIAETKLTAA